MTHTLHEILTSCHDILGYIEPNTLEYKGICKTIKGLDNTFKYSCNISNSSSYGNYNQDTMLYLAKKTKEIISLKNKLYKDGFTKSSKVGLKIRRFSKNFDYFRSPMDSLNMRSDELFSKYGFMFYGNIDGWEL